ncbi:MAG: HAD-IIB family hydrolase [Planctomycetota bacterium]
MPNVPTAIVFTDLDASLLNEDDYAWDGAVDAIEALRRHQIPLVLASSKTAAEMQRLASEIGTTEPLICENGGSVAWPDGKCEAVEIERNAILQRLDWLRGEGFQFRSFRDLGVDGIAKVTGLPPDRAALALDRHATEPLLFDGDAESLTTFAKKLEASGLTIIRGGRFFHIAGPIDKSLAMRRVLASFSKPDHVPPRTLAIGDSPNDAKMLAAADDAIVIPGPDGRSKIPLADSHWTVAPYHGSRGWGQAVRHWMDRLSNPSTT